MFLWFFFRCSFRNFYFHFIFIFVFILKRHSHTTFGIEVKAPPTTTDSNHAFEIDVEYFVRNIGGLKRTKMISFSLVGRSVDRSGQTGCLLLSRNGWVIETNTTKSLLVTRSIKFLCLTMLIKSVFMIPNAAQTRLPLSGRARVRACSCSLACYHRTIKLSANFSD